MQMAVSLSCCQSRFVVCLSDCSQCLLLLLHLLLLYLFIFLFLLYYSYGFWLLTSLYVSHFSFSLSLLPFVSSTVKGLDNLFNPPPKKGA